MSNLTDFATIRGTAQQLREMVYEASGGYHDDLYMRVQGDQNLVQFLAQTNNRQVMSYSTFSHLEHVEGDAEAVIPVGLDNDTKGYLDYLSIAEGTDKVEMTLRGEEQDDDPPLASYWSAEGGLNATIRLPFSENDLDAVPWGLPKRWTDDGRYVSSAALDEDGEIDVESEEELDNHTPPTVIETTAATLREKVIETAEFVDGVNYYPVTVENEEFTLFLQGNDGDDKIEGEVNAESVTGPDVDRAFDEGFEELFGELEGPVTLSTAPGPEDPDAPAPPLVVTQTHRQDRTIRHVLGPFAEN